MRSLSYWELQDFSAWSESYLKGARLQDCWTNGQSHIVLEFFKQDSLFWVIDLQPSSPQVGLFKKLPTIKKKGTKPLLLFLRAHAQNFNLSQITVDPKKGRVLLMELKKGDQVCLIEWVLIPRNCNAMVRSPEGKKIYWSKPKELPQAKVPDEEEYIRKGEAWWEYFEKNFWKSKESSKPKNREVDLQKQLAKKRKAIAELKASLESDEWAQWQKMGQELLSTHQVSSQHLHLYDSNLTVAENRERAFLKSKQLKKKKEGTAARIEELQREISDIESGNLEIKPKESMHARVFKDVKSKIGSRSKRIPFDDVELWIGQNAKDNITLLRRARPWYLWLHLKDYPGAYGIVAKNKNQSVSDASLQVMAQRLVQETVKPKRGKSLLGDFDVVVTEVRHVRPIKGDKLGRVTYHHPRVFTFASK